MFPPGVHPTASSRADSPQVELFERVAGPGTGYIMAAFTHLNPSGSRLSDGKFGIHYAADSVETAIAETVFHQVRYLRETREPAQNLQMR